MNTGNQNLFIVGAIENTDMTPLWKNSIAPPKKIVFVFLYGRMAETVNPASLRIDAGHYMPYAAVFTGSIHGLEK